MALMDLLPQSEACLRLMPVGWRFQPRAEKARPERKRRELITGLIP
jgi:hypothetical protein